MIHTLPEILTVIEKFGTDFPEEDEFSNQMRVAARSHVKADLANEVDSTIKGYKNTILDDLADDKFDGANGVLTLFRNHLTNRKATDIPPEIGPIKEKIQYWRKTNMKRDDKLNNIAQIGAKLDICVAKMSSAEIKPILEKLQNFVLNTDVEEFPVIIAAARMYDSYNAIKIARQAEEMSNNNPQPTTKKTRNNAPNSLILDQYDTITNRVKAIDKRVFDQLVIAGNTNSGAPYWRSSKCQHLSSNEKSAMKHFADTENNMPCFIEYNKVAFNF